VTNLRRHNRHALPISFFGRHHGHDSSLPSSKPKRRWWERANCKDVPIEDRERIFFPSKKHQILEEVYAEAHELCRRCPVKKECLDSAIEEEGRRAYGYRGDKDHNARRQLFYDRKHKGRISENHKVDDGLYVTRKKNR
jgi:hypothetical protein